MGIKKLFFIGLGVFVGASRCIVFLCFFALAVLSLLVHDWHEFASDMLFALLFCPLLDIWIEENSK